MGKANNFKYKKLVLIFAVISLFIMALGVGFKYLYLPQGTISPGVSVLGVDLGGLSEEEGIEKIEGLTSEILKEPIILTLDEKEYKLTIADFEVRVENSLVIKEAMQIGRGNNYFKNLKDRRMIEREGIDLTPKVSYNQEKLASHLKEIAKEVDSEAQIARLIVNEQDKLEILSEKIGQKILIQETIKDIEQKILSREDRQVEILFENIPPEITAQELQDLKLKEIIGEFSTNFNPGNENRTHNIKIAAEDLNGYILFPGEIFSFNEVIGERTKEANYKESNVILNNEFVPGIGGGVCQVSSTLYNVALLTNMKIVERKNHSRPVDYLPLGRDATVLDNHIDLKFRNTLDYPIMINTKVTGGTIKVRFYGEKRLEQGVKIYTTDKEEIPPGLKEKEEPGIPQGKTIVEEGKPGYRVILWREILERDKVISKEKISQDIYKAVDAITYIGSGEEIIFEDNFPY